MRDDLTDEQRKAIRSVHRACQKAASAGLVGFGATGVFLVFPAEYTDALMAGGIEALPHDCIIQGFDCDGGDP